MRRTAAALLSSLLLTAPAGADFAGDEAQNFVASTGRAQAWLTDPAYLAAPSAEGDPARALEQWAPARGRTLAVSWRNRYGARISGQLFAPPDGPGPFPGVVVIPGAGVGQAAYRWVGEDLAEHGYVVLTFDPQGQGASDVAPDPAFCDPAGEWRRPQEMGLVEQGSCAGQDPEDATAGATTDQVTFLAGARTGHIDVATIAPTYQALAPRFVLGALDATAWMLSSANPWRALIDRRRIGVAGHSLGAYAANMVGNGDPLHRFRAAVAMDAFYPDDHDVGPRVPTLMMQSEQETLLGPHLAPPVDPRSPQTLHPTRATFAAFERSDVDAGFLVPAASNHSDFTDGLQPASLVGQRTAALALIAWLDEYVAGRTGTGRLLASNADDTADRSSIGTAQPLIGGTPFARLLSFLYPTDLVLGGRECLDLRTAACAPPPACRPAPLVAARRAARAVSVRVSLVRACGRVVRATLVVRDTHGRRHGAPFAALVGPADTITTRIAVPRAGRLRVIVRLDGAARTVVRVRRPGGA